MIINHNYVMHFDILQILHHTILLQFKKISYNTVSNGIKVY